MDWRSLRSRQGNLSSIQRISIGNTRAIINAIHDGSLNNSDFETLPVFHLKYPKSVSGVDQKILNPKDSWANKQEYDHYANKVAAMFNENFARFKDDASDAVKRGAPDCTN
jgi:phosphoenolpyruvate carboxykinase (ATP)